MRGVETELHLALKVAAEGAGINDLAVWAFGLRNELVQEILTELLWDMQEEALSRVLSGEAETCCPRCGVVHSGPGAVKKRGSRSRVVRTSVGAVRFRLRQATCPCCRATWCPFARALGLRPRQRVTEELERRLVDWVTELSYRKMSRLRSEWLGSTLSPKRLHAAVQRRGAEIEFTENAPSECVVAGGTRVPAGEKERGEELTVAFAVQGRRRENGRVAASKRVVGFGLGWGSWQEALATASEPRVVVTDAEDGVAELIDRYYPDARHQLCEWHVPHTVGYYLTLAHVPVDERKTSVRELGGILRAGNAEPEEARERYRAFQRRWAAYPKVDRFLGRAGDYILSGERTGERTTSLAEWQMREINRRTDVGVRWSVSGVGNLLRLRLAQQHNPDDYERVWATPHTPTHNLVPQR